MGCRSRQRGTGAQERAQGSQSTACVWRCRRSQRCPSAQALPVLRSVLTGSTNDLSSLDRDRWSKQSNNQMLCNTIPLLGNTIPHPKTIKKVVNTTPIPVNGKHWQGGAPEDTFCLNTLNKKYPNQVHRVGRCLDLLRVLSENTPILTNRKVLRKTPLYDVKVSFF